MAGIDCDDDGGSSCKACDRKWLNLEAKRPNSGLTFTTRTRTPDIANDDDDDCEYY
jgi:hypothetical protein